MAAVAPALQAPVEIVDAGGKPIESVFCQLRQDGDRRILVAMHMDRNHAFANATIRVKAPGHVAEWDCRTGSRFAVASQTRRSWLEWSTEFPPVGEHVYVLTAKPDRSLRPKPEWKEIRREVVSGPFGYRLSEPNVCVLDLARWRPDAGAWNAETENVGIAPWASIRHVWRWRSTDTQTNRGWRR